MATIKRIEDKPLIHQFSTNVFPRFLWVVKDVSIEWIKERFENADGDALADMDNAKAVTYPEIIHKETGKYGILVAIPDSEDMTLSDCAHEALHFAMELGRAIDFLLDYDNQEIFAYLTGFATDAIYQVVTDKYKPMLSDGNKTFE